LSAIAHGFDLVSILNCFKLNVVFWARVTATMTGIRYMQEN